MGPRVAPDAAAGGVTRGFLLGKFMPPHAGHLLLCDTARRLVDRLTVLVCWLPGDPVPGPQRVSWMKELLPDCHVVGHGDVVPQAPEEDPGFWRIWRDIVAAAHPEPVDLLFAGESYGLRLAREVGARFVPVGARCIGGDEEGMGGVSASAVRADPWASWPFLPPPVRAFYARSICCHGPESVGKTRMAARLAKNYGTICVPEYGRAFCMMHGPDLAEADLLHIARVQGAMAEASAPWCDKRIFLDTDPLMTAAWSEMMLGRIPAELLLRPKADLYLMLEPDVEWMDDGTRLYGSSAERRRFADICRSVLEAAGVQWVSIGGAWEDRFSQAVAAVDALAPPTA